MDIITWVQDNWDTLVSLLIAIYAVLNIVVGLTPTAKDDEWLKKFSQFLAFLTPRDAEGTIKMPLTKVEK